MTSKDRPPRALPRPPRKSLPGRNLSDGASVTSRDMALAAAKAGLEKKATGIEIIDVTGKVDYADFLVLMSGQSNRNVDAIAHNVDVELSAMGHHPMSIEGLPRAEWVLIDFVDVVVHVFQQDARSLYDLDGLWMDARRLPVPRTEERSGDET